MEVFQLIKAVLDDIYDEIDDLYEASDLRSSNKDEAITQAINYLKKRYKNLTSDTSPIDYSNSAIRFAYIYKYVTCHSNLVYSLIEQNKCLRKLFDADKITSVCVGGGPGSDFLGLLKYMVVSNKVPNVQCTMLDRESIWGLSWHDIVPKLAPVLPFHTFFQPVDVCSANSWKPYRTLLGKADLFTLSFFMSELYHFQSQAEPFFEYMFQNAKPGAMFLYIDNNDSRFYDWFDRLKDKSGLNTLAKGSIPEMRLPIREEKKDLGEYFERFESPRLKADIAYRICKKECSS